jgi:hypothetical protein
MLTKQQWIISLIMGVTTLYYAKKQGKNPFLWFSIGFIFGLIGLCFLFFAPRRKKSSPQNKNSPPIEVQPAPAFPLNSLWYYLDKQEIQQGPMSFQKLQETHKEGIIDMETYIWNETLSDWKKWNDLFP